LNISGRWRQCLHPLESIITITITIMELLPLVCKRAGQIVRCTGAVAWRGLVHEHQSLGISPLGTQHGICVITMPMCQVKDCQHFGLLLLFLLLISRHHFWVSREKGS
jgi:hypothetical protein